MAKVTEKRPMNTRRSNEISVKHREVKEARNNTQDSEIRRSSAPTYQKENLTKVRAAAFAASPLPADASCSFVNQFFAHMCLFLVTWFHNVFHASFVPLLRDTRYLSLLPSSNPGEGRKGTNCPSGSVKSLAHLGHNHPGRLPSHGRDSQHQFLPTKRDRGSPFG